MATTIADAKVKKSGVQPPIATQNNNHPVTFLDRLDNIIFNMISKCTPYVLGPIFIYNDEIPTNKEFHVYFCMLYLSSMLISASITYNRIIVSPTFSSIVMILFILLLPVRMIWHVTSAFNSHNNTNPFSTIWQQLRRRKLWKNKKHNPDTLKIIVYFQFIMFTFAVIAGTSFSIYWTFVVDIFWGIMWFLFWTICITQVIFYYIIILLLFWQHRLICQQLNISLDDLSGLNCNVSVPESKTKNSSININNNTTAIPDRSPSITIIDSNYDNNINNGHDDYDNNTCIDFENVGNSKSGEIDIEKLMKWFDNEYKLQWKVSMQDQIKTFDMTLIIVFAGIFSVIWTHSSGIIIISSSIYKNGFAMDHLFIVYLVCTFFSAILSMMILISFMCQSTTDYFKIRQKLNNIIIYASMNDNYTLFIKSTYCLKSISKYPMKCAVSDYVVDWGKIFRITVVFTISKVVVYFLASDFGGNIASQ